MHHQSINPGRNIQGVEDGQPEAPPMIDNGDVMFGLEWSLDNHAPD